MANLEKEELVVRLDESNKKNEFLRNQISSQYEKMKSLEQELVESSTKPAIDNRSISVSLKPKTEKVYIPPFKRNNKGKPMSKPTVREHNKSVFVPTCHLCGVVSHIRPNYSLLR